MSPMFKLHLPKCAIKYIHSDIQHQVWETRAGAAEAYTQTGAMVGHVPANLCGAFRTLINMGVIHGDIKARIRGPARRSQNPPAAARYHRGRGPGRDQPGGGAELPCQYRFKVRTDTLRQVMAVFEEHFPPP